MTQQTASRRRVAQLGGACQGKGLVVGEVGILQLAEWIVRSAVGQLPPGGLSEIVTGVEHISRPCSSRTRSSRWCRHSPTRRTHPITGTERRSLDEVRAAAPGGRGERVREPFPHHPERRDLGLCEGRGGSRLEVVTKQGQVVDQDHTRPRRTDPSRLDHPGQPICRVLHLGVGCRRHGIAPHEPGERPGERTRAEPAHPRGAHHPADITEVVAAGSDGDQIGFGRGYPRTAEETCL